MVNILLKKIPNSSNEFLFFATLACAILLVIKKDRRAFVLLITIAFMITWRLFVLITSSRYSIVIIYPIILLFSIFLADSCFSRSSSKLIKTLLLILFLSISILFILKDCSLSTSNYRIKDTADFLSFFSSKKRKVSFYVPSVDYGRLSYYTGGSKSLIETVKTDTLFYYVREISFESDFDCIHHSTSHHKAFMQPPKPVKDVFMFSRSKKEKDYFVLKQRNESLFDTFYTFVKRDNTIENGDFETIETREEYINKSLRYLPPNVDTGHIIFAKNSFFCINYPSTNEQLGYNGLTSSNTISGSYSAKISSWDKIVYLFFYEHYDPGRYLFSFLVKGQPQTVISPLININGTTQFFPTEFTLEKGCIYQGTVGFIINHCDFFTLGIAVNGDVTIDDVFLRKIE